MQRNNRLENKKYNEVEEFKELILDYRLAKGSPNYISKCIRPDISYVIGHLSQFFEKSSCKHWGEFKRVLRYLKAKKNLGINHYTTDIKEITGFPYSRWEEYLDKRS
ncbi:hypothetical protein O181_130150 [Austropuccinia psidii MF-1]|uniref:Uncharacterized protein n=1 Tax=Austropuccinia psidii MF-1 TaxID=1389203 RepID=A0A9Q3QAN9_9BASI|nr:hypothetical protein [Austropuccinia psidii MF-1]